MKTFIKKQFHIGRNLKFRGGIGRSFLACVTSALLLSAAATQATTITVANANDSGAGTLRQAILDASPGDTINFAAGITTINLLSDELLIDKNLTINGPGANLLTVQRSSGADFRVFHIDSTSVVANISGLRIANGHAPANFTTDGASGGGIANGGALTIRNCTISGNTSGALFFGRSEGGGIYNRGLITISGSTISGNTAVFGGGIDNAGNATITSCTISANSNGNLGGSEGGGIENGGTVDITSCTISGNSAEGNPGGGIANGGTVRARNTIIALNTAGCSFQGCTPTGLDVSGALTSQNFNLIGNNAGATITPQPADQIGTPGSPIDPLLGPLQNNGGPTETQALLSGSPAIDKGNSSGLSTAPRHLVVIIATSARLKCKPNIRRFSLGRLRWAAAGTISSSPTVPPLATTTTSLTRISSTTLTWVSSISSTPMTPTMASTSMILPPARSFTPARPSSLISTTSA